jgi:hypothetical protein
VFLQNCPADMVSFDLVNITISVPNGIVTHDDGHILCVYGSSWRASLYIATFFAANYAAHAATIKSNPGDKTSVTVCNITLALLFPVSGLMRAVNAIVRFGRRGSSDVEKACRTGALCMVVRIPGWIPAVGQTLDATLVQQTWTKVRDNQDEEGERLNDLSHDGSNQGSLANVKVYRPAFAAEEESKWLYSDTVGGRSTVSLAATKVHGSYSLPQGYRFAILPRDTHLLKWTKKPTNSSEMWADGNDIASTYSIAKAAISIIQALAAFATLLGYREDVVRRWGFASFHLTILPYLVMTVFNFISNICTADYDCLYMVETLVMDEARERGGMFEGTVAATYTVSGDKLSPSPAELESYNGLNNDKIRALDWQVENIEEIIYRDPNILGILLLIPILLLFTPWMLRSRAAREQQRKNLLSLKRAWLGPWTKTSTKVVDVSCSRAVSTAPEALDLAEPHSRSHGSGIEQRAADSNHPPGTGEDVELDSFAKRFLLRFLPRRYKFENAPLPFHTCDQGGSPSPDSRQCTSRTTYVLTDGERLSISCPSTLEIDWSSRYYNKDLEVAARHLARFKGIEEDRRVNHGADKGALATAYADVVILFRLFTLSVVIFASENSSLVSKVPCAACDQELSQVLTKSILYFPTCHRFLRSDDTSPETAQQLSAPSLMTGHGRSRCGTAESRMQVRTPRHFGGILAQLIVGVLVNGIILTLIGSQSEWFAAGQASPEQKVIMMLWMCEGTLGMFLVILSLEEVLLAFFLLPWYMMRAGRDLIAVLVFIVPLAIFVAPVWGLVIVGQMLVDWGQCVTLYH